MNFIFLISVFLKLFGAVLEILLQITITREIGVSGYGTYTTWINAADLIFWCLFSGIVKCNTFYMSGGKTMLRKFKCNYYLRYVFPVLAGICLVAKLQGKNMMLVAAGIVLAELLVMDQSSRLLAEGDYVRSLVGEYVLGRFFLLAAILLFRKSAQFGFRGIVFLYLMQYMLVLIFFLAKEMRIRKGQDTGKVRKDGSAEVSIRKLGQYQRGDIMQAMVGQVPVILQYFVTGAFEAGVVSIVIMIRKLTNFVSGPTAKIFLPEFSRLYHAGDKEGIRDCFSSIMRIQMLFVGPLAVVLLGYPAVILKVLAEELLPQTSLFAGCSAVFLLAATLGPCGGLMQMTGNERADNHCRELAILMMFILFFVMRRNPFFALYGLGIQVLTESVGKFIFVCRWMEKAPVRLFTYLRWWLLPGALITITYLLRCQESLVLMVVTSAGLFVFQFLYEIHRGNIKTLFEGRKKR